MNRLLSICCGDRRSHLGVIMKPWYRKTSRHQLLISVAVLVFVDQSASAQTVDAAPPPTYETIDRNGVNAANGQFTYTPESISIGDDAMGLAASRTYRGAAYTDSLIGYIQFGYQAVVVFGGQTTKFNYDRASNTYSPANGDGATLIYEMASKSWTMTDRAGAKYVFDGEGSTNGNGNVFGTSLTYVLYPNGKRLDFTYRRENAYSSSVRGVRLQSVTSNTGYHAKLSYQIDSITQSDTTYFPKWSNVKIVQLVNALDVSCDKNANYCATAGYNIYPTYNLSSVQVADPYYSDADNSQTSFVLTSGKIAGIKHPGASATDAVIQYDSGGWGVSKYIKQYTAPNESATNYSYTTSGTQKTVRAETAGVAQSWVIDTATDRLISATDEFGGKTSFTYDANQRMTSKTSPEGDRVEIAYDARGNVTKTTKYPKPSSGEAPIIVSATFPASCANAVTCNKPITTTDARGGVTDYTYDSVHGGVLTMTGPTPTSGSPRPQTRYSYVRLDAFGNSSASGIAVVSTVSTCIVGASCANSADERRTTYTYGKNLLVTSVTTSSGDGSAVSSQSFTYDTVGNVTAADGPMEGSGDIMRTRYTQMRRPKAIMAPDPDGSGPMTSRIQVFKYLATDKPSQIIVGAGTGLTDSELAALTQQSAVTYSFDLYGRKTREVISAANTTFAVTDFNYDSRSRPLCSAVRMDPTQWGSQTDACAPQTGAATGPDQIVRTTYDAADRPSQVTKGYGTTAPSMETITYTGNGKTATLQDGNGNLTAYAYDGFDRPARICFQTASPTQCATSPTNFEASTFDAGGNVTKRRLRDGQEVGYEYDALGRLTARGRVSGGVLQKEQTYQYDLFGNMTAATSGAKTLRYTFDALGRKTGQTDSQYSAAAASFKYDGAGNRKETRYSDGFTVTYNYLSNGLLSSITDGGVSPLVSLTYDSIGNRKSLARANGTTTTYGYDSLSRMTGLGHDLAGADSDISFGFGFKASGQIGYKSISNDKYAFESRYNVSRGYSLNGLNQVTQSGGISVGYDARGNLITAGQRSYSYNAYNQLIGADVSASTLNYDPLDRLSSGPIGLLGDGPSVFAYDDDRLLLEVSESNAILRRYVYGVGLDEPLIWYEGPGVGDRRWEHADERGSIIALTNDAGVAISSTRYDEFGIPSALTGRFGYTGQKWLPALGLYDYKARTYSPTLGRFLQVDPAGYDAGLNLYNYVQSDPINLSDPYGLEEMPNFDGAEVTVTARSSNTRPDTSSISANTTMEGGGDYRDRSEAAARRPVTLSRDCVFTAGVMTCPGTPVRPPSWHSDRNRYNINLPKSRYAAQHTRGWRQLPAWQSKYHMYGPRGNLNTKFVSADGREAVYNADGKLITSGPNIGTYNYAGPNNIVGHFFADMLPYYVWGN